MPRTKQLGQARPSDTTAVSIYSPSVRDSCVVKSVVICNTTGSAASYRLFHDEDGTTYDETTALVFDTSVAANTTVTFELDIYMNNPSGNLAVRTGTGSALTFTAYGDDGSI